MVLGSPPTYKKGLNVLASAERLSQYPVHCPTKQGSLLCFKKMMLIDIGCIRSF